MTSTEAGYDVEEVRRRFPALARRVAGSPAAYLDGPGGTQVPDAVIDAMSGLFRVGSANVGGEFVTSREAGAVVAAARSAMADLLGAAGDEIVFGPNMTTLTFSASRALATTWSPGDNVVVTGLDHDANVSPWLLAAQEREVEVRFAGIDVADATLDLDDLRRKVDGRTRLVAATLASNAVGSIVEGAEVVRIARAVGAHTFLDAVHFAPHRRIDVAALGCDLLAVSPYKFFGPHAGCLFGRRELLAALPAFKVRPAPDAPPARWETGTPSFEALAGVTAAVEFLASLGTGRSRRERLDRAFAAMTAHEQVLERRFLDGIAAIDGVRLFGIAEPDTTRRTATFAVDVAGRDPGEVAAALGRQGIFVWAGHYYAIEVMRRLGRERGGLVRIGFVAYNTVAEVDRVVSALAGVVAD